MAPEQLRNQRVGPWTDVWALGVVLYELATGRRPFGHTDLASTVEDILHRDSEPASHVNPSLSAGFQQVIARALKKSAAERYQSAAELGAALDALLPGANLASGTRTAPVRRPPGSTRLPLRRVAAAVVVAGLMAALVRYAPWPAGRPMPTHSVLVGGVENRTGDATFDEMLPELLTTTLEQSHALNVFPPSSIAYVLQRMQRPPGTRIDEAIGREICQREGLSAVLLQSITRLGTALVLVVRAVSPDGRVMATTRQTIADPSELPGRMDTIGKALRASFGESTDSIANASVPLAEVTSRSLEAVRFYTLGKQRIYAGDPRGALVYMQKAVDTDPDFAMAHAGLGVAYQNLFDTVRAERHLREAASRASRIPEVEREKILGDFAMIRRNFDAACSHFQVLIALKPLDPAAFLSLGYCSARRLDFATALSATTKAYEMQPGPRTRLNLALVTFLAGDARKALDLAAQVAKEAPGLAQVGFVAGKAQLALGRFDDARATYQQMVLAGGDSQIEGHAGLADLARSTGHLDDARAELEAERAAAEVRENTSARLTAAAALAELALEQSSPARFEQALSGLGDLPPDPQIIYRVGRAWARGRRPAEATAMLRKLDEHGSERSRQFDMFKALLRADIALGSAKPDLAVREAEAAVGFESSTLALDTLARAYIAANRPRDAIRPLEQVIARPNERCESDDAPACYRVVEAEYWLGRSVDEVGEAGSAAPHLQKFVATWTGRAGALVKDAERRLARRR
jgi:tetratricopeptide (TPR) repeat protein